MISLIENFTKKVTKEKKERERGREKERERGKRKEGKNE